MQANTARNLAFGCFGFAALLAILSTTGAFQSTPPAVPTCKPAALPGPQDYIPIGDWCFEVPAGQPLYLKMASPSEYISDVQKADVKVIGPDRKTVVKEGQLGYRTCFPIDFPWYQIIITPIGSGGTIRVRVDPKEWLMPKNCT